MRSILYNQIRQDKIRTVKVPAEDSIDIADETGPSPERNILHNEVFRMVSALPEQQRAAILLVYVEGYKYQEAAELLGIPVGTLMSRLARARARVGKRFSEHHSAAQ
jgi:RNA polymerase sigma-70 factor (ECF subfamily)